MYLLIHEDGSTEQFQSWDQEWVSWWEEGIVEIVCMKDGYYHHYCGQDGFEKIQEAGK